MFRVQWYEEEASREQVLAGMSRVLPGESLPCWKEIPPKPCAFREALIEFKDLVIYLEGRVAEREGETETEQGIGREVFQQGEMDCKSETRSHVEM